jgi:hypothetical protein
MPGGTVDLWLRISKSIGYPRPFGRTPDKRTALQDQTAGYGLAIDPRSFLSRGCNCGTIDQQVAHA